MSTDAFVSSIRSSGKPGIVLAGLLFAAVGGCATTGKAPTMAVSAPDVPVTVDQAAVQAAPSPRAATIKDVQFKVYTGQKLEALVEDIKAKRTKYVVIIGMTPKGYQNLSSNVAELERYIREQKAVIVYLKKLGSAHPRPARS